MENGILHGNLEMGPDARQHGERALQQVIQERRSLLPYRDRRLFLKIKLSHSEAVFVVRDEGPGFDHGRVYQSQEVTNLNQSHGREFVLIRSFMDEVSFNDRGNEITIVKRN